MYANNWSVEEFKVLRKAAEDAGATYLSNWGDYTSNHLHADWR
jgi:hypothetical protein